MAYKNFFSENVLPPTIYRYVRKDSHGFSVGDGVRHDGSSYVKSTADTESNAVVQAVVIGVEDSDNVWIQGAGYTDGLSGLTAGTRYYLQDAGGYGASAGTVEVPLFDAVSASDAWLVGFSPMPTSELDNLDDVGDVAAAGASDLQILYYDASTSTFRLQDFDTQEAYSSASDLLADLGDLASKSTVSTSDLAADAVTSVKISSSAVSTAKIADDAVTAAKLSPVAAVNAVTSTSHTLSLSDAGKIVELTNASAITLTVPSNSSVAFDTNTIIALEQGGSGTVTVTPDTGVTINSVDSNTDLNGQYATAALRKDATDTWILTGNLA